MPRNAGLLFSDGKPDRTARAFPLYRLDTELISSHYPGFDAERMIIIEEGRDNDPIPGIVLIAFGIGASVASVIVFFKERQARQVPTPSVPF